MTLTQWASNGWLRPHQPTPQEIADLLSIVERDLADAILGEVRKDDAAYLDTCRIKRNKAEYDRVGVATQRDANELADFVGQLRQDVIGWLKTHHPDLIGSA
jgi:hypothetical protein